jgi:chaperone modulatory protein CbpM
MISIETLVVTTAGLARADIEHWIAQDWLRPTAEAGTWLFRPVDVARLHLIRTLHIDLAVDDSAMPMVLDLLDQLHDTRRRLRRLRDAVELVPMAREAVLQAFLEG